MILLIFYWNYYFIIIIVIVVIIFIFILILLLLLFFILLFLYYNLLLLLLLLLLCQEHSGVQGRIQHCWGRSQLKPKLWTGSGNLKSWIQKSKNRKSRIRESRNWIQLDSAKYEADYRQIQSPASYSKKKNLIINCSEKK